MKKKLLIITCLFTVPSIQSNSDIRKKILQIIKPSGHIQYDAFWDTRQVVASQEEMGIFWPKEQVLDARGNDINSKGQFSMNASRARLRTEIKGPKIRSAQSSGIVEADFFGKSGLPNIIRLRKAYLQLKWDRAKLRFGQDWHPLYVPEAAAKTISIAVGWPIQPHGRQPSTQAFFYTNQFEIILAAITQLDGVSDGPEGATAAYLRRAIVPNLHAQVRAYFDDHFIGAAIDWKRIIPRLSATSPESGLIFKVNEHNDSTSGIVFAHLKFPTWYFNTKFIYSENLRDLKQISGYAVQSINPATGEQTYTNTRALSWWVDTGTTKWNSIEPGIFIGYTKNIGARDCLAKDSNGDFIIFSRAPNLDYDLRIAPRIRWNIEKLTLGGELEFVRASFGTITNKGEIENGIPVNNVRFHFAAFYYF